MPDPDPAPTVTLRLRTHEPADGHRVTPFDALGRLLQSGTIDTVAKGLAFGRLLAAFDAARAAGAARVTVRAHDAAALAEAIDHCGDPRAYAHAPHARVVGLDCVLYAGVLDDLRTPEGADAPPPVVPARDAPADPAAGTTGGAGLAAREAEAFARFSTVGTKESAA